jgi:hypothetical protein
MPKLITVETPAMCIACFENTLNRVECCTAGICKECYYEWLKTKRQCMHCKADQCDFNTWVNEYRVEPEFDPQEYLHNLLQEDDVVYGTNPMFTNNTEFSVQDLLNVIHQNLHEATGNPYENILMPPSDLPPSNVPFEFQFGFAMTPTDLQGNPTGDGDSPPNADLNTLPDWPWNNTPPNCNQQ